MDWKRPENRALVEAFLTLKSGDEARRFLRDLMTEGEIQEFGKRLRAAELLSRKVSYSEIEKKTGLSSTTVARVSKWLNGKEGGYRTVIDKLRNRTEPATKVS
jgi:TrpR-related protein YerC/YecD